ncbi:la-related protein 6A-like isoform X2 [Tripterygium wilfordii]|uniref:la-related protein 6A-like isoform X2 n=1 Tax=Tripterygium wilfordii TaxID=458696 RepID=UPI0018F86107|nr:la-related protein 6A-like isoform X2 [Tripterygium wilfordii]
MSLRWVGGSIKEGREEATTEQERNGREGFSKFPYFFVKTLSSLLSSPLLMEDQAGPAVATAVAVSLSPSPQDPDSTTVESSNLEVVDVHPQPSDDDLEHDQDNDHGGDGDKSTATGDPADDLKRKIIKQVEYYFSDENLPTDKYLLSFIKKNKDGFVPISVIASFRKMKKLSQDYFLITAALRESSLLVVSSDAKKVKRIHPLHFNEARDPKFCTVLVENLPEDHSVESIQRIFGEVGNIKSISIRDLNVSEDQKKMVSRKLHALVEYETLEAAEKAVATLTNEDDWRNGMRVKLYKIMGKNAHRKQAWRGSDSQKNSTAHATGDEENHNLSEHHDDSPDEERTITQGEKWTERSISRTIEEQISWH